MRLKLRHLSLIFAGLCLASGINSYPKCEAIPIGSHQASTAQQSRQPATTPGEWQLERIAAFPATVLQRAEVIVLGPETFVLHKWSANSKGVVESKSLTGWHRGKEVEIGSGAGQGLMGPRPAKGITAPLVFRIYADGHFEEARILHGRSRLYIDEEHLKPKLNLWVRGKGKVYI